MSRLFKCEICGNEDPRYIGYINNVAYCRKCASFKGREAQNDFIIHDNIHTSIKYELTKYQKDVSSEVLNNYKNKYNQLIYAVCGAGKTEIVFEVIEYALKNKQKVGFTIPRRDVVIELSERLKNSFKNVKVITVYGGNNEVLEGDIVCLTTHQLYRYNSYFDLLILDELDAFPYKGSDILNTFFLRSVKGNYIMMSATLSDEFINNFLKNKNNKLVKLFCRFHLKNIPVPVIKIAPLFIMKLFYLIYKLRKMISENKQVLIFVPTIELSKKLFLLIKNLVKPGYFLNSSLENRNEIVIDFKNKKYMYLVTTAVLERGVTLENLQVIVFEADHEIYNEHSLIQIAGRVGRKAKYPKGEVIFLATKNNKEMGKAISKINESNDLLQKMLQGQKL